MDEQRQDDLREPTYGSSVQIWDVACRKQWTIEKGGEKGTRISVLMVRHDDDDDDATAAVADVVVCSNSVTNKTFIKHNFRAKASLPLTRDTSKYLTISHTHTHTHTLTCGVDFKTNNFR